MSWMSVEPGATRLPNVAKVFALLVLPRPSRMKIELPGSSQPSATRPLPETIISTHSPSFDKNAQFVLHRRMVSPPPQEVSKREAPLATTGQRDLSGETRYKTFLPGGRVQHRRRTRGDLPRAHAISSFLVFNATIR